LTNKEAPTRPDPLGARPLKENPMSSDRQYEPFDSDKLIADTVQLLSDIGRDLAAIESQIHAPRVKTAEEVEADAEAWALLADESAEDRAERMAQELQEFFVHTERFDDLVEQMYDQAIQALGEIAGQAFDWDYDGWEVCERVIEDADAFWIYGVLLYRAAAWSSIKDMSEADLKLVLARLGPEGGEVVTHDNDGRDAFIRAMIDDYRRHLKAAGLSAHPLPSAELVDEHVARWREQFVRDELGWRLHLAGVEQHQMARFEPLVAELMAALPPVQV
jgi:hypothetical protein